MATYKELKDLTKDSDLQDKVEVAVVVAANNLLSGTPTTAQKAWAADVFGNPSSESKKALMAVLASNSAATVAQIRGAADSLVQAGVDAVVSVLVDAKAGV